MVECASKEICSASKLATTLAVVGKGQGDGLSGAGGLLEDMVWFVQCATDADKKTGSEPSVELLRDLLNIWLLL